MRFKIDENGKLLKVEKIGKKDKVIVIPDGVTSIGQSAFSYCDNVKEVVLPKSLKRIERYAFSNCRSFEKINIPSSVEYIGSDAFLYCVSLKKIEIPEGITSIEDNTFYSCKALKEIKLPSTIKRIGTGAFNTCDSLQEINIPKDIETIESYAFCRCEKLKSIDIPTSIKKIGKMSFFYCTDLKNIELPKELEVIEESAFEECVSIQMLNIPSSVKRIEKKAFSSCTALRKVHLPDTVESISSAVFKGSYNIVDFTFGNHKFTNLRKSELFSIYNIQNLFSSKEKLNFEYLKSINNDDSTIDIISSSIYLSSLLSTEDIEQMKELTILIPFLAEKLFCIDKGESLSEALINNKKEFNKVLRNLLKTDTGRAYYSRLQYYDLFKLAYTLGAFSDNQIERQKACEFISNFLEKRYIDLDKIHGSMESLEVKEFNKEWAEFFMNKKNFEQLLELENEQTGYMARIYNSFKDIKEFGRSNRGDQHYRKVTVDMCVAYLSKINFDNVNPTNQDIVQAIKAYTKRQDSFDLADEIRQEYLRLKEEKQIDDHILGESLTEKDVFEQIEEERKKILISTQDTMNILNDLANKKFTYEFLSKYDPKNFVLGKYCSCCAHLEGAGFGIMKASILHPDCQNLVIKNRDGKIIAKSTLYVNRSQGYGVFNNIEVSHMFFDEESKMKIYDKYIEAIDKFVGEYNKKYPKSPIEVVTVGMGLNDLTDYIKKNNKKTSVLQGINFSEYGTNGRGYNGDWQNEQYVLWEKDKPTKKK